MPRPGPRRPLLAARVDPEDMAWIEERREAENMDYPSFVRLLVTYARTHMPDGWHPDEPAGSVGEEVLTSPPPPNTNV